MAAMQHTLSSGQRKHVVPTRRTTTAVRKKQKAEIARWRAEGRVDATFFSGEEAFVEVGKEDGLWNWCLAGPDDQEVSVAGGGRTGVEEMVECLSAHACLFGLLRLNFSDGDQQKSSKWLFVQASNADDSDSNFSMRQRGQALTMESKMAQMAQRFCSYIAKVQIRSKDDCTLTYVLDIIKRAASGCEAGMINEDNYMTAEQEFKNEHPELFENEERIHIAEEVQPPAVVEAVHEDTTAEPPLMGHSATEVPGAASSLTSGGDARRNSFGMAMTHAETVDPDTVRQRKPVKVLTVGDQVDVFSKRNEAWVLDGEVMAVAHETCIIEGVKVRAGSVKVVYDQGTIYKWVSPAFLEAMVRESLRPRPPEVMTGCLMTLVHGKLSVQRRAYYFLLGRGFLQWYLSERDAQANKVPVGCVYLLGLQLHEEKDGRSFQIKSDGTKAVIYTFQASKHEEAEEWIETLWENSEYCEETTDLRMAKLLGNDMRRELMESMTQDWQERKESRKSIRMAARKSTGNFSQRGRASTKF